MSNNSLAYGVLSAGHGAAVNSDYAPRVSVIIPTLNEARNLPSVFARIPAGVHEVIVVDGRSVDDTLAVARQLRPDVRIVMQTRKGKGNALACGFAAATGDIIAMIDADGSADPGEIPRFVQALVDGADFAKGTRFGAGAGSSDITPLRGFGNQILGRIVNVIYGTAYSDLCYGFNVFWRHHLPVFGLDAGSPAVGAGQKPLWGDGFEVETLMNIRAATAGLSIVEVPSFEHPRIHGTSNLNTFRDGRRVLRTILAERFRTRRHAGMTPEPAREVRDFLEERHGTQYVAGKVAQDVAASGKMNEGSAGASLFPSVSVVIAAYATDRWNYLQDAVKSVQAQTIPVLETVVVVDHNPELLSRARRELNGVIVIASTGLPGASGSRNAGVAVTHGEIVAFLDDDACAEANWLEALLPHFVSDNVVGVGGRVDPLWATSRPRWFPPEFDWTVGASYPGMPNKAQPIRNVWSNNMAIRRSSFNAVSGFRDNFGKVGQRSRPEDTDLCLRSAAAGNRTWMYEPDGVAGHWVPQQRTTLGYFVRRCFNEGLGKAALSTLNGASQSTSTERDYARRVLPRAIGRGLREAAVGDVSGGLRSAAIAFGFCVAVIGFVAGRTRELAWSA